MTTPAGWYPSPDGMPVERFWDGSQWTQHQRVPSAQSKGFNPAISGDLHAGPTTLGALPGQATLAPPHHSLDLGRIERGSNRWILGIAMLILSVVLSLSSFAAGSAPWGGGLRIGVCSRVVINESC